MNKPIIDVNNIPALKQKGVVVWLFGLSGAGKTTISTLLKEKLEQEGFFSIALDGDILRAGINKDLGFNNHDRAENVRRAAEIAKMLAGNNIITICSFITPLNAHRQLAADIIGGQYFEVFLDCPLEICKTRDVKGLYKSADLNLISNFTGVSAKFEPTVSANLIINTNEEQPAQSRDRVFDAIIDQIRTTL